MIFAFDEFELHQPLFELRREGDAIPVQPKVLDLLLFLIRNRERVVSKEELLRSVWPDEVVSETALTHAVMEARHAVRDDGARQRIIQTVRRRGYRFIAPVTTLGGEVASAPQGAAPGEAPIRREVHGGGIFVGRERPLAQLRSSLDDALAGHGRVALIAGEPGIGKTRTAEVLAAEARAAGAEVLVGRCVDGEGAPAFWPWVQILRGYLQGHERADLERLLGASASVIAQAVPELRGKLGELPEPPELEPARARFRLFDHLASFLRSAAAERPLLLVVDDLHRADRSALLMLQFLAREIRQAPILVVGTYRDADLARDPAASRIMAEIAREDPRPPIYLDGLTRADVSEFLQRTTGRAPSDALLAALHHRTGGNPFFLSQLVQLLEADGARGTLADLPLSQGMRDAIRRHLDVLSGRCQEALAVAAVIGGEFALGVLAAACAVAPEALLESLGEAIAARVVIGTPNSVGLFRFAHSLIRETLYGELHTARRAQLHARVGDALAIASGANPEPHLAELAHHYLQAAPAGRADDAITYAVRAAEQAAHQLAYEQAATFYQRALEACALSAPDDPRRLRLLLERGSALWRAGDGEHARESFQAAAELARNLADAEALARAALGFGAWDQDDVLDERLVHLLEEALRALGERDSPLRARVMGRLARELRFSAPWERLESLSQAAVEMARRCGDTASLADSLVARHWALWGPANTEDRFEAAVEIVQLAEQVDNRSLALQGRQFRLADLLELGDIAGVDLEIDAISWLADELHQSQHQWFAALFRAMRALVNGRFEEAEGLAQRAFGIGERVHRETALQWFGVQMGILRREQGRLEEAEAALQIFRKQYPWVPTWRCELALTLSLLGRRAEARSEFEHLAARDFSDLRPDSSWLASMAFLSAVCSRLEDRPRAERLYELLLPCASRVVSVGPGVVCYGSAARFLGLLARTLGRFDDAAGHFDEALEMHARMGARPLIAHTERNYARLLLARGGAGDRERARVLAGRALATARELRMQPLVEAAEALRAPERATRRATRSS